MPINTKSKLKRYTWYTSCNHASCTNSFSNFQANSRIKGLKRQLDESEEEVSREKAARRKIQRELEDLIAENESKEREINNLKNKLR